MASPAFVYGAALKRDRLHGGVGASLAREMRFGVGSIMRPGVATLTQEAARTLDTANLAKGIRANLAGATALNATGMQRARPQALDLGAVTKDTRAALRAASPSSGLLAKTDTANIAKQMRADITTMAPLAAGGLSQDAMRSFGALGIGKGSKGVFGLNASARELFGGIDTAGIAKQMRADVASVSPLAVGGLSQELPSHGIASLAADLGRALGFGSVASGLLAKTDTANIAKQMRADITTMAPLAAGGLSQDAMRSFGALGIGKGSKGVFGLNASARELFGGIDTAGIAKQMALRDAQLMQALRSTVFDSYETPSDAPSGSDAMAEPTPVQPRCSSMAATATGGGPLETAAGVRGTLGRGGK